MVILQTGGRFDLNYPHTVCRRAGFPAQKTSFLTYPPLLLWESSLFPTKRYRHWSADRWRYFLSQSKRLPLLQVLSNNKSFSVGVQSPTEINAPRGCAVILRRICQLSLTIITHQVSRAFDLNLLSLRFFIFRYCLPDIGHCTWLSHQIDALYQIWDDFTSTGVVCKLLQHFNKEVLFMTPKQE